MSLKPNVPSKPPSKNAAGKKPNHSKAAPNSVASKLPDAAAEKELGRFEQAWLKLSYFCQSKQGMTWLLGGLLFVLVAPLLSIGYLNVDPVAAGGLAKTTINAPRTFEVEDRQATRIRKEQARSSVAAIYQPNQALNQEIRETLLSNVNQLEALFQPKAVLEAQASALVETVEVNATRPRAALEGEDLKAAKEGFTRLMGDTTKSQQVFSRLAARPSVSQDSTYWERIRLGAQLTLNRLLKRGLNSEDYFEQREELLLEALPNQLAAVPQERGLVQLAVLSVLQPNLIVDEEAMHLARQALIRELKPITRTFRKGEPIIKEGEPVTDVQRAALQLMGIAVESVNWAGVIGVVLVGFIFCLSQFLFLYGFENQRFFKPSYGGLIVTLIVASLALLKLQTTFLSSIPLYAFPLAAFSLIMCILTHSRLAILATTLWVFLVGLTLHLDFYPLSALLLGSLAGIFLMSRKPYSNDRKHLMLCVLLVCVVNALVVLAVFLLNHPMNTAWELAELSIAIAFSTLSGLLAGILTIGCLPFLEAAFRLLSPYRLQELANHDQPLLRQLQFEAPGTFHHSLMLANLSEAAAEAIGANPLLTRVGCLYHDIGKTKRPLFFIENQAYFGVDNPHDRLTPRLSKLVITSHPKDSIEMAQQAGLPEQLQAFMTEHHGTLMCGYFYQKAVQEEGVENVQKSQFRYAGPKPQSKETAVVMLADAAESAVRALKSPTLTQMDELLSKLFKQRIDDGQFDRCPITFQDIQTIKETFLRVLMGIQHNRINYQEKIIKEFGDKRVSTYGKPPAPSGAQDAASQATAEKAAAMRSNAEVS